MMMIYCELPNQKNNKKPPTTTKQQEHKHETGSSKNTTTDNDRRRIQGNHSWVHGHRMNASTAKPKRAWAQVGTKRDTTQRNPPRPTPTRSKGFICSGREWRSGWWRGAGNDEGGATRDGEGAQRRLLMISARSGITADRNRTTER